MDDGGGTTALITALRTAATPDLYRDNTFRQSGRTVGATPPPALRPYGLIRHPSLGFRTAPGAPGQAGLFPGQPASERTQKRSNDPVARAVDDFFWFWSAAPGPGQEPGHDAGMAALEAGDTERADAVWEAAGTDVAHHNLAVLNHMLALDADHAVRIAAARWRRSYKYWRAIWRSDPFWDLFAGRVAPRGDPRLGPSTASTFREHLPLVLARIGALVALRWAERRQSDEMVVAHWQLVQYDGFPEKIRNSAQRAGVDAVVALTRARIEYADRIVQRTPWNGAVVARALHDKVGPALHTLTLASAAELSTVQDEVAEHLLRCTATYVKDTGDWPEGLNLLYLAQEMAQGRDASGRIDTLNHELHRRRKQAESPGTRIVGIWTLDLDRPRISTINWPPHLD